jgi:hypothetical protein
LGSPGLAGADLFHDVGLQAAKLGKQAVRGLAVIAAHSRADGQLDGFLILLAERAGREHRVGVQHGLQCGRTMRADAGESVRHFARGLLDLAKTSAVAPAADSTGGWEYVT